MHSRAQADADCTRTDAEADPRTCTFTFTCTCTCTCTCTRTDAEADSRTCTCTTHSAGETERDGVTGIRTDAPVFEADNHSQSQKPTHADTEADANMHNGWCSVSIALWPRDDWWSPHVR